MLDFRLHSNLLPVFAADVYYFVECAETPHVVVIFRDDQPLVDGVFIELLNNCERVRGRNDLIVFTVYKK